MPFPSSFPNGTGSITLTAPAAAQTRDPVALKRLMINPMTMLHLLAIACSQTAPAQEVSLLVQRSALAGFRYYEAPMLATSLRPGETLDLVREPENPHDANAIRVEWRGRKLGYVPRRDNPALAWAMDNGELVTARIAPNDKLRNNRRRISFDVLLR